MARTIEPGEIAKYKYKDVQYSHIEVGVEDSLVLTADPWSYLYAYLTQKIPKTKGSNRRGFERAIYYANLAENFFRAGDGIDLPAKGTLIYYGMLNLVKCLLASNGVELETVIEHHGLTLPLEKTETIEIQGQKRDVVNIFAEFADYLGTPVCGKSELTITSISSHIPELHEVCYQLGHLNGKKHFLPIEIDFLVNSKRDRLFTEIRYRKGHESQLPTGRFLKGEFASYFQDGYPKDGWIVYRSKKKKNLTNGNWDRTYRNICREYRDFRLSSLLSRTGYRYYCDLRPGKYHHLCYTHLLMYYIGTAARYRPKEIDSILSGTLRLLITEAIALCPHQFLYQIVSEITKTRCVIPYAKLD